MTDITPRYYVELKDQLYNRVAFFDAPLSLSYRKAINEVGTYSMTIQSTDNRVALFELDGMVVIHRSIPGVGLDWYEEFVGLHRSPEDIVQDEGITTFTSHGVDLRDFIARTIINYKEGTIKAEKSTYAETAIKEYVIENCGNQALVDPPYERLSYGVLPDFEVEASSGLGSVWEGSRAFENLLDVIQAISAGSKIDFNVIFDTNIRKFIFKTYYPQFGFDRTTVGLDPTTGYNAAGNRPVIFMLPAGNILNMRYTYDRTSEVNVVSVLGDGDGATREVQVVSRSSQYDSPWNRRESSRAHSGYISEMQAAGNEDLDAGVAKEVVEFSPLQQATKLYGFHYDVGDKITIRYRGQDFHKRILSADVTMGIMDGINLTCSDL